MEQQIKQALESLLKDSIYAKANRLEERVNDLFNIHKTWIAFAKVTHTAQQMAEKLFIYENNLRLSNAATGYILADKYSA